MLIERGAPRFGRTPWFAASVLLHVAGLSALVLGPMLATPEEPRPVFNRQIKPFAEHIVWYNMRTRLPRIKPAAAAKVAPARARRIFRQPIVAGKTELPRPPQLIRVPAPQISLARPLKLPNLLAVAPPKPVRPFQPPPEPARPPEERSLAAAPPSAAPAVPHELTLYLAAPRPQPLPFIAPTPRPTTPALSLPAEPTVAAAAPSPDMPRIPRGFSAPPDRKTKPAAELPAEPAVADAAPSPDMPRIPRGFSAPDRKAKPAAVPALDPGDAPAVTPASPRSTLAIVGLAPIDTPRIPKPPGAHEAGFSAGPRLKPEGGPSAPAGAAVVVPDLMVHGAHQVDPALLAALRPLTREGLVAEMMAGRTATEPAGTQSARLVKPPDPRLAGRAVYTISIQMPNVTSFSGSWLVWFAERQPLATAGPPSNMESPVALHKVDPKYYREAMVSHVEGTVRLFATIRKDGQVDAIEILHGIDSRLDRSAAEALAKWQFEPAKRAGVPVDVDAVFEVPFHLEHPAKK
jgi:TonB family protein